MRFIFAILSCLLATLPAIGQNSSSPNLLYWAFQENSHGTAGTSNTIPLADSSQHGGTIGWLQQPYDIPWELNQLQQTNAVHFNGVASILYTTNNAALFNFTTNDFTVYFNINSFGGHFVSLIGNIDTNNPTAGGWYVDTDFGQDIRLHMENGGDTYVAQDGVTINGWTQIVITRHGTNVVIYSNGLPGPLTTGGGPLADAASSSAGLLVGQFADGSHTVFDGNLYQVGIWNQVLDFYTIQDTYNQLFPNMVDNWNLRGNTRDSSWYVNSPASFAAPPVYAVGPDGVGNHAAQFNGTSQYLTSSLPPALPTFAFGLSFWVKPAALVDNEDLFQWASDMTSPGYAIQTGFSGTAGQIYCLLSSDGVNRWGAVSSLKLQANVWNHVAFSWFGLQTNGGYPQIYINGVMDTNQTFNGNIPGNNPAFIYHQNPGIPFQFGRRYQGGPSGTNFSGAAANIQVYKNGLTPAEVWSNYVSINGHVGAPADPLVPLTIQIIGTDIYLSWQSVADQIYQVEYNDNLATPAWTSLGGPVTGTGGMVTVINNFGGSTQRMFRLRLLN